VREIVAEVRSKDLKHFILEQALLASLVDGQRSRGERAFIQELAVALRVPEADVQRLELEMAEFYARHRSVVDVFTVSAAAGIMGEDFVSRIQEALDKNFHRVMQEVRETGDLAVLLAKAARGQKADAGRAPEDAGAAHRRGQGHPRAGHLRRARRGAAADRLVQGAALQPAAQRVPGRAGGAARARAWGGGEGGRPHAAEEAAERQVG